MKQLLTPIKAFLQRWWMLIAACLVLLFITFRSCKTLPSHKDDKKTVDSAYVDYKAYAAEKDKEVDSLRHALKVSNLDKIAAEHKADSLEQELTASTEDLRQRAGELKATLKAGDQARVGKDTIHIVSNSDTLRNQVRSALVVAERWARIADSAIAAHKEVMQIRDLQDSIRDQMIVTRDDQLRKADTTVSIMKSKYDVLFIDYSTALRGWKFNKMLTHVEGAAVLIALIKIFVIK